MDNEWQPWLQCDGYALINKQCLQSGRSGVVGDWAHVPWNRGVPLIIYRDGQRCLI